MSSAAHNPAQDKDRTQSQDGLEERDETEGRK